MFNNFIIFTLWMNLVTSQNLNIWLNYHGNVSNEVTSCKSIYSCFDCYSSSICRPNDKGGLSRTEIIKCPSERPFCDFETGTCSPSADRKCGKDEKFQCSSEGKFPDVDCLVYHECSENGSKRFECKVPDEIYDASLGKCSKGICGSFNCSRNTVAHSVFPSFYAFCRNNEPAIIYKCPENYEFNDTSNRCEPVCHEEGIFADYEDCTKFFKCDRNLFKYHLDCPKIMGFDSKMCIPLPSNRLPFCQGKNILTTYPDFNLKPQFYENMTKINLKFECIKDGIFPSLNCSRFHVCSNLVASSYECPIPGYIFDPEVSNCTKSERCGSFNCTKGRKVKHTEFPNFFAYCTSEPVFISSCPRSYELNTTSQTCEAICRKKGLIQDAEDCTRFYDCESVFIDKIYYNRTLRKCPPETVFHPELSICVNSISIYLPNCKFTHRLTTTETPISECMKKLTPECRNAEKLKKNCVVEYLHVGAQPECKEEIKILMSKLMNNKTKI